MNKRASFSLAAVFCASLLAAGCSSGGSGGLASIGGMSSLFGGSAGASTESGSLSQVASGMAAVQGAPVATGSIVPPREESESVTRAVPEGGMAAAQAEAGGGQDGDNVASAPADIAGSDVDEEDLSPEELHRRELINRGDLEEGQPLPAESAD